MHRQCLVSVHSKTSWACACLENTFLQVAHFVATSANHMTLLRQKITNDSSCSRISPTKYDIVQLYLIIIQHLNTQCMRNISPCMQTSSPTLISCLLYILLLCTTHTHTHTTHTTHTYTHTHTHIHSPYIAAPRTPGRQQLSKHTQSIVVYWIDYQ